MNAEAGPDPLRTESIRVPRCTGVSMNVVTNTFHGLWARVVDWRLCHRYRSTACAHGLHDRCRVTCKWCRRVCRCRRCRH